MRDVRNFIFRKTATIISVAAMAFVMVTNVFHAAQVPKAPILVLETPAEFGAYTQEILRAEGFNEFLVESPSISDLTVGHLDEFDVVILTETKLNASQIDMLSEYVRGGGNLIAFRPDKQLAPVFGISDTGSSVTDGYIKIVPSNDIGKGLTSETLQFHGDSEKYELKGANRRGGVVQRREHTDGKSSGR